MDDQPEKPIAALWAAWEVLWDQHGRPSPGKIARWSAKNPDVATVKESTIRGWMKPPYTTVPDWNDGFRVLLQYIDSITPEDIREGPREQDRVYWRDLWLKADDRRKARLAAAHSDATDDAESDENTQQQTGDTSELSADGAADTPQERLAKAKLGKARIRPWKVVGAVGISTACVLAIFWPIDRGENVTGANGGPSTESRSSSSDTRYCAHVTKEPAGVYPKPDVRVKEIKFKPLNSRVEVYPDREHPPGWIVVHTPKDPPGTNWMQSTVLTEPAPCVPPLPGEG